MREKPTSHGESTACEEVVGRAFFAGEFFIAAFPDSEGNDTDNGANKEDYFNRVHIRECGGSLSSFLSEAIFISGFWGWVESIFLG